MSWGIEFTATINRVTKSQIVDRLDDAINMQEFYRNRLIALCSDNATTTLNDADGAIVPKWEYVACEIPQMVQDLLELGGEIALLEKALMADDVEEV